MLVGKCICFSVAKMKELETPVTMLPLMLLMLMAMARSQETTPDYTVTYNPGNEDCLPYDGSVVPDCSKYFGTLLKEPYYHEHSTSKKKEAK